MKITKPIIKVKCVVCEKIITHTVVFRKCCRDGECREKFSKLKKCWKKNKTSHLTTEELFLYNKLKNNGNFMTPFNKNKEQKYFESA